MARTNSGASLGVIDSSFQAELHNLNNRSLDHQTCDVNPAFEPLRERCSVPRALIDLGIDKLKRGISITT